MLAEGCTPVRAAPGAVRAAILDAATLARIIPGAESVVRAPDGAFTAILGLGVGPFRGRQTVRIRVDEARANTLLVSGHADGPFGAGRATGGIDLLPTAQGGTVIAWHYEGEVHGPVALAGSVILRLSAAAFTAGVFRALGRSLGARCPPAK